MMIEKYSKAEIVDAIKYKAKYDVEFEPMLVATIKKLRNDRAFADWEIASKRYTAALDEFSAETKKLIDKYGKINPSLMTDEEYHEYIEVAKEYLEAEKQEKWYYERLKKIEEDMLND